MPLNMAPDAEIDPIGPPVTVGGRLGRGGITVTLPNGDMVLAGGGALQIIAPDGTPRTGPISIQTPIGDIAVLTDGRFVITGSVSEPAGDNSFLAIVAQVFEADGTPVGDAFLVNTATAGSQLEPQVTAIAGGGFIIGWDDRSQGSGGAAGDSSGVAVKAQVFDANAARVGGELLINATTNNDQRLQDVRTLSDGNVVFVWDDYSEAATGRGGVGYDVRAQIISPSGGRVGGEFIVNENRTGHQRRAEVDVLTNGNFAVIWDIDLSGNDTNDVGLRVFSGSGAPLTGDIIANTERRGYQYYGDIVQLATGGFVVAWEDHYSQQIRMQRFSDDGAPVGGETIVAPVVAGTLGHVAPQLGQMEDGGLVVAWSNQGTLFARTYDMGGTPTSERFVVAENTFGSPLLTPRAGGGFMISWDNNAQVYDVPALKAWAQQPLDLKGSLSVTDADAGSGIVTATLSVTFGTLHLEPGSSGASITNNGTASVTISGTIAQIGALLRTDPTSVVQYQVGSLTPPGSATLTLGVNDNGNAGDGGARTDSDSHTIYIAVDAAPVVMTGSGNRLFDEPSNRAHTPIVVDPSLTVTDADHVTLVSATVRITSGFTPGQDVLSVGSALGGITWSYDASVGILTLTSVGGAATVSQWQATLRTVSYLNSSDAPTTDQRTVSFSVSDGIATSNLANRGITVLANNDAPLVDLNGAAAGTGITASYPLRGPTTAIAPGATVTDADSGSVTRLEVFRVSAGTAGQLSILSQGAGAGQISVSGDAVYYEGVQIGTWSAGQTLLVLLNGSATPEAAQALVRAVAYTNSQQTEPGTGPSFRFVLTDVNGGTSVPVDATIHFNAAKASFASPTEWAPEAPAVGQPWYVGDFNGDGKDDIFRWLADVSGADMFLSDGGRFVGSGSWLGAVPDPESGWFVGDFNGDGKDDIFRYIPGSSGADMFLSTGTGFQNAGSWTPAGFGADDTWHVGDFNGDGRDDIFRYIPGSSGADMFLSTGTGFQRAGSWTPAGFGADDTWHIGDFNGDGRDDIFRYIPGSSGADMFLSTGTGFQNVGSWTPAGFGADDTWHIGDFNGDGRDDIFRYIPGSSGADMFLSTGTAFQHVGSWTPAGFGRDGAWYIGDFNGDGNGDLLRVIGNTADVLI